MCDNAEFKILHKDSFVTVSTENLDFLADVYSWRWCWVSGPRYLAVGLGVSYIKETTGTTILLIT